MFTLEVFIINRKLNTVIAQTRKRALSLQAVSNENAKPEQISY